MTRQMTRLGLWALLATLLLCQPGCGLLVSPERQVKRYCNNLQVATNNLSPLRYNEDVKKCAAFFVQGARYYPYGATVDQPQSPGVFFKNLSGMALRNAFYIHVKQISKVTETKYVMIVQFQQRTGNNVSTTNYFWDATITWVKIGEEWRVEELKETSAMRAAKA